MVFNSALAVVSGSAGFSGGAFAATAVNSLGIVSLGGLFNLAADSVESAAAILGDSGALVVELADTRFTGAGAVISSGVLSAPLDTNPTPNTVVDVLGLLGLTGVSLILNEQILTGDGISNAGLAVNAIHLEFNDFASGLGILNGDIIIGHSEAQVQALPAQVPEPGTLALTALALAAMLRFRHRGSTSASVRPVA